MVRNNISRKLTDWVLCNSSYSLEPAAFDTNPMIRPIGPLLASNRFGDTTGSFWPEDSTCLKWLDQQQSQSFIPFLWVVRPDAYPAGFQDRVGANDLIVSWAPQQKVLEHQSVACFVSHCGWNSTMEGVSNGIPFLCWPYFADQFHNKSYLCDVWKVGLVFNRDERGIITRDEIKAKVEQLLLENSKYKANALNLKEKVMNSIKGGESYCNFMNFVDWVKS
ncbi:hypothetical protein LWI29_021449 [Acer saccharum]|uniref:Uncharacterized protein n=1 Tax=Acer saccharum TaxID=4024 RepID=A0AA39WA27_ACESA|nr:hypothetical protein LWI29_021449 [Acer saccharum]